MSLKSQKLWMTIITVALLIAKNNVPGMENLTTEEIGAVAGVIVAYLISQGIADHGKERVKAEKRFFETIE